jgi:hypothetical protein
MIKISFTALWKLVVVILLAIIAIYAYRIDKDLRSYHYTPYPIGCGVYNTSSAPTTAMPNLCAQPLSNQKAK